MNLPDGMSDVMVGRIKGANKINRCYRSDLFKETLTATSNTTIKHFLSSGKERIADDLKRIWEDECKNINTVRTYSSPFRKMTDTELKELADNINLLSTNIGWIEYTKTRNVCL